ncbi:hypothetical protein EVAR_55445_1 [Eumeta japonica]|uniref:Uncharacterized protein n=1 Tax=Eumeta variegata TaxID=151549 RepID=A0A4C1Y2J1_EUMVA|nr:hypothetical protein EVAR_55445_1 [Eumeta japonica]
MEARKSLTSAGLLGRNRISHGERFCSTYAGDMVRLDRPARGGLSTPYPFNLRGGARSHDEEILRLERSKPMEQRMNEQACPGLHHKATRRTPRDFSRIGTQRFLPPLDHTATIARS